MSAEKFVTLQHQMRQNQSDLQDFMKDLDSWSSEIKSKDEKLKTNEVGSDKKDLPPVRNSLDKKKTKKKKRKPKKEKAEDNSKQRISGYDFQAWDKFDVNKACADVDDKKGDVRDSSSSEYETDEEWEELRMKQQANLLKDQGNQYFKEGKYDAAIECYTRGISADQTNALLPANRAMALIKLKKYAAAELDCTLTISLDPTYIKAYQRRGTARLELGRYGDAKADFSHILTMETGNKMAKAELERIDKLMNPPKFSVSTDGEVGVVKPIYKHPKDRSKAPLRRVLIQEVGVAEEVESQRRAAVEQTRASQSSAALRASQREASSFDKFITPAENSNSTDVTRKTASVIVPDDSSNSTADVTRGVVISSPADIGGDQLELRIDLSKLEEERKDERVSQRSKDQSPRESGVSVSPRDSPRVPPTPHTSYQLQADWKLLKHADAEFFQYFKEIPPKNYPKLFGEFLDAEILLKIFACLRDFFIPNQLDIVAVLQSLTQVKRFNMTVMFLSKKEQAVVDVLFQHLSSEPDLDTKQLAGLKKLYNL